MTPIPLDYARPDLRIVRRPNGFLDWVYLALVACSYGVAVYEQIVIPGAPNCSYAAEYSNFPFEYANFVMTLATGSAIVLCAAGLWDVYWQGWEWKRCAITVTFGIATSGLLAVIMLVFSPPWMSLSFF